MRSCEINILLPMLTYMSAGNYHFNYKPLRSPNATFASVSLAHVLLVEGIIAETGATEFRNPLEVRGITQARARARYTLMMKKRAENEEQ